MIQAQKKRVGIYARQGGQNHVQIVTRGSSLLQRKGSVDLLARVIKVVWRARGDAAD